MNAVIGLCTIIIAGVMLAMLYKYGGLLNAVGFHFFWNFLEYNAFTLGSMQGALHVTESGTALLTGGSFGPEASIVALPVVPPLPSSYGITIRKRAQWTLKHRVSETFGNLKTLSFKKALPTKIIKTLYGFTQRT